MLWFEVFERVCRWLLVCFGVSVDERLCVFGVCWFALVYVGLDWNVLL